MMANEERYLGPQLSDKVHSGWNHSGNIVNENFKRTRKR